jgi:putative thioredoxin
VDITDATFEQEVIQRSHEVPVVVDFWAPWCGPCRQLAPLLEDAVALHGDEVVLAKVNIDENPGVARAFNVQSIPLVKAFRDGRAVDEFVGAQPRAAVDAFLLGLVPTKVDRLVAEGDEASLREALELEPGSTAARLALARLLLADGGPSEELVALLEPVAFDPAAAGILARVRLAADESPDVVAGLAALDEGRTEQALTHLLDAVRVAGPDPERRDRIRAAMVGVFGDLGEHHPLTVRFRKRLAQALY